MASKVDTAVVGEFVVRAKSVLKAPKDKKSVAPKKPRAHPPYFDMIREAISCLKERNGSSQYAIAKFIEEKHKDLPPNFKKVLLVQLRKLVASAKLTKVKNSFKLSSVAPAEKKVVEKKKVDLQPKESTPVKGKKKGGTKPAHKKAKKVAKTEKVTTPGKKKVVPAKKSEGEKPQVTCEESGGEEGKEMNAVLFCKLSR